MVRVEVLFITLILVCFVHSYPESRLLKRQNIRLTRGASPHRTARESRLAEPSPKRDRRSSSEGIIFPDEVEVRKKFVPKIGKRSYPECAKGDTFCEHVDDYPASHLNSILQKTGPLFRHLFGNDSVDSSSSLSHRIEGVDEHSLCIAEEAIVYPKTAMNKENQWLFIINQGEYIQGVRIEKCLNPKAPCHFHESFPNGYKTTCKQKYIYRKLLAISSDGRPISDTFQLPSCCMCMVGSIDG